MRIDPLEQTCGHVATAAELRRDPQYVGCAAGPGEACRWARREDGEENPAFHSERLEWAAEAAAGLTAGTPDGAVGGDPETLQRAVLASGVV